MVQMPCPNATLLVHRQGISIVITQAVILGELPPRIGDGVRRELPDPIALRARPHIARPVSCQGHDERSRFGQGFPHRLRYCGRRCQISLAELPGRNFNHRWQEFFAQAVPFSPASGGAGEGLPSGQITAIAFDKQGNIFVGTQCDGIAMASRESDYSDWHQARLADQDIPTYAGFGLPSRLINDLLAATDGTIYVATDGGMAGTRDGGENWQFRRGKDFPDKLKGLAGGPPKGWSAKYLPKDLPPEDYVTCLAEDDCGVIWADFRQHGMLALSGYSYEELDKLSAKETGGRIMAGRFCRCRIFVRGWQAMGNKMITDYVKAHPQKSAVER